MYACIERIAESVQPQPQLWKSMFPRGKIPERFKRRNIMYYMNLKSFSKPDTVLVVIEAVLGGGMITDAVAADFVRMDAQAIRERVRDVMMSSGGSSPHLVIQRLRKNFERAQKAR